MPLPPHIPVSCSFSLSNTSQASPFLSIFLLVQLGQPTMPICPGWGAFLDVDYSVLKPGQFQANWDKLVILGPDLHHLLFLDTHSSPPAGLSGVTMVSQGSLGHLPNPCPSYLPTTELGHVTLCLKPLWHFPFSMAEGQEPSSALHSLASLPLHLCLQPPSAGHLHCGVWKCFCRHTSVLLLMPLAWPETPFHPSSSPSSFHNS